MAQENLENADPYSSRALLMMDIRLPGPVADVPASGNLNQLNNVQ
jgi:hypothetical protein